MRIINVFYYAIGIGAMFCIYWVVTSERWHNRWHRNSPRWMMHKRLLCGHCFDDWYICVMCNRDHVACQCNAPTIAYVRSEGIGFDVEYYK